jgi:hypothetical protein
MKRVIQKILITVALVFIVQTGFSEYRTWTDQKGKQIEAEFIRIMDDKVVLQTEDGEEIKVSLDTLSNKDRKYAALQTPPRIEIKVSTDMDRENTGHGGGRKSRAFQVQQETVQVEVTLKKTSSTPYEEPLESQVYLIGQPEQRDGYGILDRTVSRFRFTEESENLHSYSSGTVELRQLEAGKQVGIEYEGYLAVVKDRTGAVLAMKCSRLVFEKNAEAIMEAQRGTIFDEDFNLVDSEKTKGAMGRRGQAGKHRIPGRRF